MQPGSDWRMQPPARLELTAATTATIIGLVAQPADYIRGVLVMSLSSLLFSVMATLIRFADRIDSFSTAFYRFAVGMGVLVLLALFRRIRLAFTDSRVLFLRGLLGGIAVVLFYLSIVKIGIAKGTVISFAYPVFATLGGMIFLKERVRGFVWLLLAASLFGMALMTYVTEDGVGLFRLDLWTVLAVVGAVVGGLALVCVKRLTTSDSGYSIFMSQCVIGFWMVLIPANMNAVGVVLPEALLLIAIGLCATVGQLCMNWGFGMLTVSTGALLGLLTPVINVFVGIMLFREPLGWVELTGAVLVLASCTAVVWVNRETRGETEQALLMKPR